MRTTTTGTTKTAPASKGIFFMKNPVRGSSFFESTSPNKFFGASAHTIHRKCDKCAEEEQVQRKSTGTMPTPAPPTPTFLNNLNHSCTSLSRGEQQFFGERMNYDFTDVKIHTDKQAAKSASALNAQAYTFQNHIVFNESKYQPSTFEGRKLLSHELVHVIQQSPTKKIHRQEHPATVEIPLDPAGLLMELENARDATAVNMRLRRLTTEQAYLLLFSDVFIQGLQNRFSGMGLAGVFSIILNIAHLDAVIPDLTSSILHRQAQLTADLISLLESFTREGQMHLRLLRIILPQVFEGNRLLPQMMAILDHRALRGTVPLFFAEAHYEENQMGQMEMSRMVSLSAPIFRVTPSEMRVIVRIKFVHPGASRAPFLFTGGDLPGILAGWLSAIDRVWNNQFILVNPTNRISLVFIPMIGMGGHLEEIQVQTDNRESCGAEPGRATENCWYTSDSGQTIAHEFGHLIGASDEYHLPASASEIPAEMGLSEEETGLSTVEGIRAHAGRQLRTSPASRGSDITGSIMAGGTEVHIQHVRRLVNGINEQLRPALRFRVERTH